MKFVVKESTVWSRRIELSPYQLGHILRRTDVRLRRSNDMERPWQPNDLKKIIFLCRPLNAILIPSFSLLAHRARLKCFTRTCYISSLLLCESLGKTFAPLIHFSTPRFIFIDISHSFRTKKQEIDRLPKLRNFISFFVKICMIKNSQKNFEHVLEDGGIWPWNSDSVN